MSDGLGPLPCTDRQDSLQHLSLTALRSALPESLFLFRDERVDDKGVDGSLEIKIDSHYTNFRAQVQLKATENAQPNKDGSISLQIETSNLNYLLNGQCPIYILWIASIDELRFSWAREEWRRLDIENPQWRNQGTITVRFQNLLTSDTFNDIHRRTIQECRLEREIHEQLSRNALSETVTVRIDSETLATIDSLEIQQQLLSNGMTIVSSGYAQKVISASDLLEPRMRQEPRIQLVLAYAHASLGNYFSALGFAAEADLLNAGLERRDMQFLQYLCSFCEYETRRLTYDEFQKREQQWRAELPEGHSALQELEILRLNRQSNRDMVSRANQIKEMQRLEAVVSSDLEISASQKLLAKVALLGAEGDGLLVQFIEERAYIRARKPLGLTVPTQASSRLGEINIAWQGWQAAAADVIAEAARLLHPLLIADSICMRLALLIQLEMQNVLDTVLHGENGQFDRDRILALMAEAETAQKIYTLAGHREGEVRAKLMLADLFDFIGQPISASEMARTALSTARAMGYALHEIHARELVTGQTKYRTFLKQAHQYDRQDVDFHLAKQTDAAICQLAKHQCATIGLPEDRLQVIEKVCFAQRTMSQERISHCRHLELLENAHAMGPQSNWYRENPEQKCFCRIRGIESASSRGEIAQMVAEFKAMFCNDCDSRTPKGIDS